MECRCEDILKCNSDIITLQDGLGRISQITSRMVSAEGTAQRMDNYEAQAYLLEDGIRSGAKSRRSTKRQLAQAQVNSAVSQINMTLQRLQQELISLRREDTVYHEEERRRQEEEARRQYEQRQAALKKLNAE